MRAGAPSGSPPLTDAGLDGLRHRLARDADRAFRGEGRLVFLTGPAGPARARVFGELRARLAAHPARPAVVSAACADDGRDVWLRITASAARRRRVRRAAWAVLPDYLALVPVAGKVLSALASTIQVIRGGEADEADGEEDGAASAPAAVRDLLRRNAGPLAVLLDCAESADAPDLAGLAALSRRLERLPILLVVAVDPAASARSTALHDIMLEAERSGRGTRLALAAVPGTSGAVGGSRAASPALRPEDMSVLAAAAAQGQVFHSLPLARASGVPELELEERLTRLARAGVLEARGLEELGTGELTGIYAFRSTELLQDLLDSVPGAA